MSQQPFRDAEAWLAERGVRRERIRVAPARPGDASPGPASPQPSTGEGGDDASGPSDGSAPPPSASERASAPVRSREAMQLARASADEALRVQDARAADPAQRSEPRLEDEVAEAVAFVRRSTANAPQAQGRLAVKLAERGWPSAVVDQALERSRAAGLVDDEAMAAALIEEGRRKGHAPTRLRADLRRRELGEDVIERALAEVREEDPEAAAFDVARRKAATLTGVSAETAFRRVVGHLARRGHPEALARKVARAAVFEARDAERTAGH